MITHVEPIAPPTPSPVVGPCWVSLVPWPSSKDGSPVATAWPTKEQAERDAAMFPGAVVVHYAGGAA